MGMCADVIAIGPFSPAISGILDYPKEHYRSTKTGATIAVTLFGIFEGSIASRAFAACLGITDPWDFNQHKFDPNKVGIGALRASLEKLIDREDYFRDVDRFILLRDHGFELFIFRPNG